MYRLYTNSYATLSKIKNRLFFKRIEGMKLTINPQRIGDLSLAATTADAYARQFKQQVVVLNKNHEVVYFTKPISPTVTTPV